LRRWRASDRTCLHAVHCCGPRGGCTGGVDSLCATWTRLPTRFRRSSCSRASSASASASASAACFAFAFAFASASASAAAAAADDAFSASSLATSAAAAATPAAAAPAPQKCTSGTAARPTVNALAAAGAEAAASVYGKQATGAKGKRGERATECQSRAADHQIRLLKCRSRPIRCRSFSSCPSSPSPADEPKGEQS